MTSEPMLVAMIALPPSSSSSLQLSSNDILLFDDPIISQITRDTSKPGWAREDGAECWVVHSTASYARTVMEEVAAEGGGKEQVAKRAGDNLYQVSALYFPRLEMCVPSLKFDILLRNSITLRLLSESWVALMPKRSHCF